MPVSKIQSESHPISAGDRPHVSSGRLIGLFGAGMNTSCRCDRHPPIRGFPERAERHLHLSFRWTGAHDSFDMKQCARDFRGEFQPIDTNTPGFKSASIFPVGERSHLWALCRSLTHSSNDHSASHQLMLTGRSDLPRGSETTARSRAIGLRSRRRGACFGRKQSSTCRVLPDRLVHATRRVIPGQFRGMMGSAHPCS